MLVCVWLVSSLIHMISGCSLSGRTEVTGYTGGSVDLPCYCTEGQPTPNTARWHVIPHGIWVWLYPNTVGDRYKDRVYISATPGDLSLRLSDLTLSDGGTYSCEADGQRRDISLTVKEGCVLSDSKHIDITGFTGDSVDLPCACTNVQKKPEWIRWTVHPEGQSTVIFSQPPRSVNDHYKDRVQVLDSISPGILSLRLSHLTLLDKGTYQCEADGNYRDIILTVKESCVLSDSEPIHITGFTGDSVVLPCACTDVQKKPGLIKWTLHTGGQNTVIFPQSPRSFNDHYKHRVQVLDSISPGNLSLRLSHLTLSDGGTYWCEADGYNRDIILTVKGCVLSDYKQIDITGFTGDSVVLPCACTNVQKKPEWIRWTVHPGGQSTIIFSQPPRSVNDQYKRRVQVLDSVSPGNLSLRLSDLTLLDGGTYRCEADGQHKDIILTVKETTTRSPTTTKHVSTHGSKEISEDLKNSILYATIAAVVAAVAVCGAVLFYCRVRSRKNAHVESREEQEMGTGEQEEEENADSVTYSTVVHSKTVKNTNIQNQSEDSTEYAAIKLGMSSNS